MAVSAVSSKLVRSMAAAEGFGFREVLTGFKWHGTAMAAAQAAGERVLFSFEEAIGFACGDVVRDKDGVGAAAVFAEMAQHLARTRGLSVAGRLREIYAKYGHFVSANGYVIVDDPSKSAAIFARLRAGGSFVGRLPLPGGRGLAVTGIRDLTATPACPRGWDSAAPGGAPTLPVSSSGNMVTLTFANGAEVTLRTSEWRRGGEVGKQRAALDGRLSYHPVPLAPYYPLRPPPRAAPSPSSSGTASWRGPTTPQPRARWRRWSLPWSTSGSAPRSTASSALRASRRRPPRRELQAALLTRARRSVTACGGDLRAGVRTHAGNERSATPVPAGSSAFCVCMVGRAIVNASRASAAGGAGAVGNDSW